MLHFRLPHAISVTIPLKRVNESLLTMYFIFLAALITCLSVSVSPLVNYVAFVRWDKQFLFQTYIYHLFLIKQQTGTNFVISPVFVFVLSIWPSSFPPLSDFTLTCCSSIKLIKLVCTPRFRIIPITCDMKINDISPSTLKISWVVLLTSAIQFLQY